MRPSRPAPLRQPPTVTISTDIIRSRPQRCAEGSGSSGSAGMPGRRPRGRWVVAVASALLLAACAELPTTEDRPPSRAVAASSPGGLSGSLRSFASRHAGRSGIRLVRGGPEALAARLVLTERAVSALDAQYYIWHNDASGRRLARELLRAADRGVRIRLLLDDLGSTASDESLLLIDEHPGIEARLFNPVAQRGAKILGALADFGRTNHRMHNKAFIMDNQAAVIGGRNIGDEYFGSDEEMNFADLDVIATGPVVEEMSESFDRFWNSPYSVGIAELAGSLQPPDSFEARRRRFEARVENESVNGRVLGHQKALVGDIRRGRLALTAAKARVVGDDPEKLKGGAADGVNMAGQIRPVLLQSEKRVILVSPYFVPGKAGVETLAQLAAKGVEVIVLTNSLASNDVPAVHAGYRRYRKSLLRAGVRLYEFKSGPPDDAAGGSWLVSSKAGLHAKTFTFDDRVFFVGSMNLDPRSVRWNTETGLLVENSELAVQLSLRLLEVIGRHCYRVELREGRIIWTGVENGRCVTFESEPDCSRGLRLKTWLLGLLPLENQI